MLRSPETLMFAFGFKIKGLTLLYFFLFSLCTATSQAQGDSSKLIISSKIEREERIKAKDFPTKSHDFLRKNFSEAKRIRYYRETEGDTKSYEAKFKKVNDFYSVKFTEKGEIYDVEKTVKPENISEEERGILKGALSKLFFRYNIKKLQLQFSSDNSFFGYEVEIKGFAQEEEGYFEINLDRIGNVVRIRKIERQMPVSVYW
jgi:hypothetical protein